MSVVIKNAAQLAEAKEDLARLKKSWRKVLEAQSYTMGSNQINRASLAELKKEIDEYEAAIDAYETRGTSKRRGVRITPLG